MWLKRKKEVGQIRAFAAKRADATNTMPFLRTYLPIGAVLHTDESSIYQCAKLEFIHQYVTHRYGEYARGAVSTTTIDGFWNLLKRSIRGTYTHVSFSHLNSYVDEHTFRYNNTRSLKDGERFNQWFKTANRRLTYKALINN